MELRILDEIEQLFLQKIAEKNSWGKNEVKDLYRDCQLEVLKRHIKKD